jgi:hypothetical protein
VRSSHGPISRSSGEGDREGRKVPADAERGRQHLKQVLPWSPIKRADAINDHALVRELHDVPGGEHHTSRQGPARIAVDAFPCKHLGGRLVERCFTSTP